MRMLGLMGGRKGAGASAPTGGSVVVYVQEFLTGLAANDTDIAGRALVPGPGLWQNTATNTFNATTGTPPFITGALSATARYVTNIVAGQASQEAVASFEYSSYANSSCGLILQDSGDGTTRYDCFISGNAPHNLIINRYEASVETTLATSGAGAASFFPINTVKEMGYRSIDNGDGTYDLEVYVDDVLIVSATDSDPLTTLGRAGIRGRNTMSLYSFEHRSLATDGGGAPVDTTAPTLTLPVDAANGQTAATGSVTTNEANGTLYWVVTASATEPNAAQIKAGQNHAGAAAAASGSQAISSTGAKAIAPSGLTAATPYYTYFMHEDAAGNQSDVAPADGFTTDPVVTFGVRAGSPTITNSSTSNSTSFTPSLAPHEAGDSLVVLICADGNTTLSCTGWTQIFSHANGNNNRLSCYRRDAVAASAAETNPTFTASASEQFEAAAYSFTGDGVLVSMAASTGATGFGNAPNPDAITPGGTEDFIWIAIVAADNSDNRTVTGYPSGYSGAASGVNGNAGGVLIGVAHKTTTATTTENPGAFALSSAGENYIVKTIGVWL